MKKMKKKKELPSSTIITTPTMNTTTHRVFVDFINHGLDLVTIRLSTAIIIGTILIFTIIVDIITTIGDHRGA